jgi:hypothetical protein
MKKLYKNHKYFITVFLLVDVIAFIGALTNRYHTVKIFANTKSDNNNNTSVSQSYTQPKISIKQSGNTAQLIDLNEGLAQFNINYPGYSNISVFILKTNGDPVASVADSKGPYKRNKTVYVPQTGQYILDVKCDGEWSVSKN